MTDRRFVPALQELLDSLPKAAGWGELESVAAGHLDVLDPSRTPVGEDGSRRHPPQHRSGGLHSGSLLRVVRLFVADLVRKCGPRRCSGLAGRSLALEGNGACDGG